MIVKIVTYAPIENADDIRDALGNAGAGVLGEYSFCSFSINGTGRFVPGEGAHPHIGVPGKPESVAEERIEVTCQRKVASAVIEAMKAAHPYEEVAFDIYPLLDESEL